MGKFFRQPLRTFHCLSDLGFKTEEDAAQSCSMGLSGETVGLDLLKSDGVKSRFRWLKNKVSTFTVLFLQNLNIFNFLYFVNIVSSVF